MSFEKDITEIRKLTEVFQLLEGIIDDELLARLGRTPESLQELMRIELDKIAQRLLNLHGKHAIRAALDMFPSSWSETTELVNTIRTEKQRIEDEHWNRWGHVKVW